MTSLIFGSIYLSHKGIIQHRRSKQREKNYQRWEGLRDEYDEQKRHSLDSSLDSRPSFDDVHENGGVASHGPQTSHGLLTLRDRQEAGDARTGWRPQESWDHWGESEGHLLPNQFTGAVSRSHLIEASTRDAPYRQSHNPTPVKAHKTGTTWDEDLPAPLQVTRRSFEDHAYPSAYSKSRQDSSKLSANNAKHKNDRATTPGSSSATSSVESLALNPPSREYRRVAEPEVVESPFEWWKQ